MGRTDMLTENQIKHLVDRFLGWHVPENFAPDAGITYTRLSYQHSADTMPSGTNILDATQADAMVRYMAEGLPEERPNEFGWLIEAPGPTYLATRNCAGYDFHWTTDACEALRFASEEQCDAAYMAIRGAIPDLFAFERNLRNAMAVEHGFIVNKAA